MTSTTTNPTCPTPSRTAGMDSGNTGVDTAGSPGMAPGSLETGDGAWDGGTGWGRGGDASGGFVGGSMDDVRVIQGDCLEVLPTLAAGSVDLIVTSPPYNQLGKNNAKGGGLMKTNRWSAKVASKGYADDMAEEDYRSWLGIVAEECVRVTRPGGSMFFNHKIRYRDGQMIHPLDYVRDWTGWEVRQEIVWDRAGAIAFNCGLFAPADERIYWLVKPGGERTWNEGSAGMLSIWRIPSNKHINSSVKGHPCPFPIEIPARCIKAVTKPGDMVLDPFAGSGTTLEACMKSGRRGIGIEMNAQYLPVIQERLNSAQTPIFDRPATSTLFDLAPRPD